MNNLCFFVISLIALSCCQQLTGGTLSHFYTDRILITQSAGIPNGYLVQKNLNRLNVFSANEDVFVGTALEEFSYSSGTAANINYLAHIEIVNAGLTSNRKAFQFNIKTNGTSNNLQNQYASITRLRVNYIIIGEQFPGYSNTIPSSYIWARNGQMIVPSSNPTVSPTLVDFGTTTQSSPFLYSSTPVGCGASKINGQWVLENNCSSTGQIVANIFITGLDMKVPSSAIPDHQLSIGNSNNIQSRQIDLKSVSNAFFTSNPSADGLYIYFKNLHNVNSVQLSTIVVALKQYSLSVYPEQGANIDPYIVNTYISADYNIGSGVRALPYTSAIPYFGDFPDFRPWRWGHRFCGLNGIQLTSSTPASVSSLGFTVNNLDLISTITKVQSSTVTTSSVIKYTCILVTSRTPCLQNNLTVTYLAAPASIVPSTGATVAFSGVPAYPYSIVYDSSYLNNVYTLASQNLLTPVTITYILTVPLAQIKLGIYQGVLHISTGSTLPSSLILTQTITINIFGNPITTKTQTVSPTNTIHFSFNNALINLNNTIVITYTLNSNSITPILQILQFGLGYHNSLLDANTQCVSTCPITGTGLSIGADYKTIPPTCLSCDMANSNQIFSPTLGACICASNYYQINTQSPCLLCPFSLCSTCSVATCQQCVQNANFINQTNQSQGCQCAQSYYQSGTQCLRCGAGCATCTKSSQCVTCLSSSISLRKSPAQLCVCMDGYYESGQGQCLACASECVTCMGNANNCTSCNVTGNFVGVGTACLCATGYYISANNNINNKPVCLKCDSSCLTCQTDSANCLQCKSSLWTKSSTNKCICTNILKTVQYQNGTSQQICIRQDCSLVHPSCLQCVIVANTLSTVCSKCSTDSNTVLSSDNTTCLCKVGYVNVSNICTPCGNGCQVCSPINNVCSQCALGAYALGNSTCQCQNGYYLDTVNNVILCAKCDGNCATCSVLSNNCTSCYNNFTLSDNNVCLCLSPYYPSVNTNTVSCLLCPPGCKNCTSPQNCTNCQPGYILNNNICLLNCPAATYNGGDQCLNCSQGCSSCTSVLMCQVCQLQLVLYIGTCRSGCPNGTYVYSNSSSSSNSLCLACSQVCATCSQSPTNCTSCPNTLILYNSTCINECPSTTYFNGSQCTQCSPTCLNCSSFTTCTACPSTQPYLLYNNTCSSTCPTYLINNVCQSTCGVGNYSTNTGCARCNASCVTCTSSIGCTSCKAGLYYYNGICYSICPQNSIVSNSVCIQCDSGCVNGCTGTATNCTQCQPNTYRYNGGCVNSCPISTYPQQQSSSSLCMDCDSGCKVCVGPYRCVTCFDNVQPVNGVCAGSCGGNCVTCNNGTCLQCANGYYWNGVACLGTCPPNSLPNNNNNSCMCQQNGYALYSGMCVPNCPAGMLPISSICIICTPPCLTCSITPTKCITCINNYIYDQVSSTCLLNSSCGYGQYRSSFNDCRYICLSNNYYLDSACYIGGCPPGYQTDPVNRVCSIVSSSCPSNCLSCLTPSQCVSCSPGYTLNNNNVCVLSGSQCTNGQVRYRDTCVSVCVVGTFNVNGYCVRGCGAGMYYWNGGCYQNCPTILKTPDACVVVCPSGFIINNSNNSNNTCSFVSSSVVCVPGQYYNPNSNICQNCRAPCLTCSSTPNTCTSCAPSYILNNNTCINSSLCPIGSYFQQSGSGSGSGCLACPTKCRTCTNANVCTSCGIGYVSSGADCILNTTVLQQLVLNVVNVSRNQLVIFVQIQASIIPNNLPASLSSQLVYVVAGGTPTISQVNVWVQNNYIYVALTHTNNIPTYDAYFIFNSNTFDSMYRSLGYSTANAYAQARISYNVSIAPVGLTVPVSASNARVETADTLATKYNSRLNLEVVKAVRDVAVLN